MQTVNLENLERWSYVYASHINTKYYLTDVSYVLDSLPNLVILYDVFKSRWKFSDKTLKTFLEWCSSFLIDLQKVNRKEIKRAEYIKLQFKVDMNYYPKFRMIVDEGSLYNNWRKCD